MRKRDRVGCLPTQMTSKVHPLSQIWRIAVTTKNGCQGDPLYLSIKGTLCEDYSNLQNKELEHWHPSGHNKSHSAKQNNLRTLTTA